MKRGEIVHHVSRGAFYLMVEKAAALVSGMVYFALLLRWLGPTKYGTIILALSFVGVATMATGNLEMFLERHAAEFEARGRPRLLWRAHGLALLVKTALGLVAGALLVLLAPVIAGGFGTDELSQLLPPLALLLAFDGLATTGRATLYGLQQYRWISIQSTAFHLVKTVMVGTMWWLGQGLMTLAFGLAALAALQGLVLGGLALGWMRRVSAAAAGDEAERERGEPLLRPMLAYCLPLYGARAAFLAGQNLGKIVLGKLFDPALLGYFAFAFQTLERFVELAHTLPAALLPTLTRLVAGGEQERLRLVFHQAFRLIQLAACFLALLLFAFAREITLWVGSPLFEPAIPLLMVMALVPVFRTAHQPLTLLFQAMRRPGTVLTLAVLKLVTELAGYLLLVPALGLAGAGWAIVLGAGVAFLGAHRALRRLVPVAAGEPVRASLLAVVWLAALGVLALAIDVAGVGPGYTMVKLGLFPVAVASAFALGLVTAYDLEKLASVPLTAGWMRRLRDAVVAGGGRLERALSPRRAL